MPEQGRQKSALYSEFEIKHTTMSKEAFLAEKKELYKEKYGTWWVPIAWWVIRIAILRIWNKYHAS